MTNKSKIIYTLTDEAPPTSNVIVPPTVFNAPTVAAPVVVIFKAPPAVLIVSPEFMEKVAELNVTEPLD